MLSAATIQASAIPPIPPGPSVGHFERRHAQPAHGRQALLDALHARLMSRNMTPNDTLLDAVRGALRTAPQAQATTADLLLSGFSTRLTAGYPAAAPILRAAVTGMVEDTSTVAHSSSALALGCLAAGDLLDNNAQRALATRWLHAHGGEHDGDADVRSGLIPLGPSLAPGAIELLTLARRGDEVLARSSADECIRNWTAAGRGGAVALAHYAMTILDLGHGRYEGSLDSVLKIYRLDPPGLGTRILPDLIEAAARSGDKKAATSALERLSERALASGTRLACGLLARSRALLSDDNAEDLFQEAIEHLRQSDTDVHLARTHLVYGEWLRRKRRRRDARGQLRAARESFEHLGYAAFAHRAAVELQATGETARKRIGDGLDQLTPREAQVTRLVAEGSSNRGVASQLFISENTVEYHLKKAFRKVGVTSRTQLAHAVLDPSRTAGKPCVMTCS
jgi:DNA-binding NarL/FixJ family response regulator